MLSPGSRGKGSRRRPRRDGGRRRKKDNQGWRKRAPHAAKTLDDLTHPIVQLVAHGYHGDSAHELIYKFDQQAFDLEIPYYAECWGWRNDWDFKIWVPAVNESNARELLARINGK